MCNVLPCYLLRMSTNSTQLYTGNGRNSLINYQLSQKFKLVRNCEFNHSTIILHSPPCVSLDSPLISGVEHVEF